MVSLEKKVTKREELAEQMLQAFVERSDPDDPTKELKGTIRPFIRRLSDEQVEGLVQRIEEHMLYYNAECQAYTIREISDEGEMWDEELTA